MNIYNASVIKISLQSADQQTMKGVKINNYIDNRIMLSGRKLKNQMQTLIQSNQPAKPIVIRHLNYIEAEQQQVQDHTINTSQKQMLKPIDLKAAKKKKKRTKTATANIIDPKTKLNLKEEAKNLTNKQSSRKNVSAKKRSSSNSPGQQSTLRMNETQRKLKSASKSAEGLGKRSKSAIIKRNKSPSNNVHQFLKNTKDENSLKLDLSKRKDNNSKKKNTNKNKSSTANLEKIKTKQLKKNASNVNVNEKLKRFDNIVVNACRAGRPASKSYASSTKNSKPVSARERTKKEEKGNGIARNLFQTIDHENQHITLKNLLSLQKSDKKLKQALLKLQDALNSGSNRKKLSDKLQILAQKLKQIDNQNAESQNNQEIHFPIESVTQSISMKGSGTISKHIENNQNQENKIMEETKQLQNINNKFTNQKIIKDLSDPDPKKDQFSLGQQKQMKIELTKVEQKHNHKLDPEHMRLMLQHENGIYETNEDSNPLIGRKAAGDAYFDLADYDSINSVKSQNNHESEKQQEINQLKKFQQQSDLMMKKIKNLQNKAKSQKKQTNSEIKQIQVQVKVNEMPKEKQQPSPKNIQINNYAFEKYPSLQKVRSPKLNTEQINEVIKIKQKVLTDRHQKLSQLVNLMYEKKLVSPKTYSIQVHSLRQQQQQNNEVLDNYRKHAEQLAQLLSDIKKQKQEITNIDEMIRFQKWEQAKTVIDKNQKIVVEKQHSAEKQKQKSKENLEPPKQKQEDSYEQAVYYEGEDSQVSDSGFKLVQVQHEEEHQNNNDKQANNLIQIDEADQKVQIKQRGFDSNLFFIKEYCIALCEYVRDNYKDSFRKIIGVPMSYDLNKLLKSFRTNRDGTPAQIVNSLYEELSYHDSGFHNNIRPISKQVFNEFNLKYETIKYFGKETSQNATLQGIFLSSIYDALNESISIEKPGSINGEALPWAASSKHLKNMKNTVANIENQGQKQQESEDLIFGIAIARIIQWGSCLCGFIPDTVELENTEIDEEYINHIRQTRTALLLQKMLIDEQALMHRNDLQITEVQLHLSDIIFEDLLKQFLQDNRKIQFKKSLRQIDFNQ